MPTRMDGLGGMENGGFEKESRIEHIELDGSIMRLEDVGKDNPSFPVELAPAVIVRQATKSYGSTHVLRNYNMTVPEGTIYSLLGSSGCGKTTILSAIVGLKGLDSGEITVFGEVPGSPESGIPGSCVGHMPQEHALHLQLSIQESFNYYGLLYNMPVSLVKERSDFLIKFLNLPKSSQRNETLSGGQKRRVSLAIAMLHEPKLLILDEPTVGVDHLLRESIWNLLTNLVANGKTTVIITTHYIEEARCSSTIGVMRSGRLLVEKNPKELLQQYNVNLLEDIVSILSRQDTESDTDERQEPLASIMSPDEFVKTETYKKINNGITIMNNSWNSKPKLQNLERDKSFFKKKSESFSRVKGMVRKNLTILFRKYIYLFVHTFSPAFQILIICLAIGNEPRNLKFGVVNNENPEYFNALDTPDLNFSKCGSDNWGSRFLDTLRAHDILNLVPFETENEAVRSVEEGSTWGYLSIPSNFSADLRERMISGVFLTNESYEGSTISFQLDMSSQTIGASLQRTFFLAFQKFTANLLVDCDYDPRASELPIKFKEPIFGSTETTFREYLAPSTLLGLLFFFPLCAAAISYIGDKKNGTQDRSLVAGVTTFEVMSANLVTESLILLVQSSFSFLMMIKIFNIEVQGSLVTAILLTIIIGIGGMSMGFVISTFCTDEIHAVHFAMGSFFPNFLLAGMLWPIEGMPQFLQYLSYCLPCTLACESMRSIITRGWGFTHYKVWSGFASTFVWIVIYWSLTIFIHRRLNRSK